MKIRMFKISRYHSKFYRIKRMKKCQNYSLYGLHTFPLKNTPLYSLLLVSASEHRLQSNCNMTYFVASQHGGENGQVS